MTMTKSINDLNNILSSAWPAWKPNRMMVLDTPLAKSKPVSYINGVAKKWTVAQHEKTFQKEFIEDQIYRVVENNCNVACIPVVGKYWILDIDSGKVENEITNPAQLQDFNLLLEMAKAHSNHSVKTPNGYHFYLPPSSIITKTSHLCCVDIQYTDVYCVAPMSRVKNGGEYSLIKWETKSPKKCGPISNDLNTALDRYLKYTVDKPTRLVEKVVNNKLVQEVVSIDSKDNEIIDNPLPDKIPDDLIAVSPILSLVDRFARSPVNDNEHYKLLGDMVWNYDSWRLLAFRLKSAESLWGEHTFKAFCYISQCNKKYYEIFGETTEEDACKDVWDKQSTSIESALKYYNMIKKQFMDADKWFLKSINCINLYTEDYMVSSMLSNFAKTLIRACHDGGDCSYYKINPKTVLWEYQQGGDRAVVNRITKIFLKLRTDITSSLFPVIINFDIKLAEVEKPPSAEYLFIKKYKIKDENNLTFNEKQLFQQFKLIKVLFANNTTLEKAANYSSVWKFLQNDIVDVSFNDNKDKIAYLIPLKDAYCINLKTGETIERLAEHYFTTTIPCTSRQYLDAKGSDCTWFNDNYMMTICANDKISCEYAQKILGSGLCGEQISHIFTMIIGKGRNGKSFLLSLLKEVLGTSFYHPLPENFWCKDGTTKKHNGASPDDADLEGKRFICQDEMGDDSMLDTTKMRRHSGGSEITCRGLYKSNRTFTPSYSCIMCSNSLPAIDIVNHAVTERLRVWDMPMTFYEKGHKDYDENNKLHAIGDPNINKSVMENHIGSCINWLVVGCVKYYNEGMAEQPQSWIDNTKAYMENKHLISRFVSDYLDKGSDTDSIDINQLDKYYKEWVLSPKFEAQGFEAIKKGSDYYLTKNGIKDKFADLKMVLKTSTTSDGRRVSTLTGWKIKRCCLLDSNESEDDSF